LTLTGGERSYRGDDQVKVGVVLPLDNIEEQWIADCLESIEDQTLRDFRLVIVVDGADSQTIQSINKAVTKLSIPFVILHRLERKGILYTLDEGFAEVSDCEYTTWISGNKRYDRNYLQTWLEAIERPLPEEPSLQSSSEEQIIHHASHPPIVSLRMKPRLRRMKPRSRPMKPRLRPKKGRKLQSKKTVRFRIRLQRQRKDNRKKHSMRKKRMIPTTGRPSIPLPQLFQYKFPYRGLKL
jgi:hypothetical protein